MIRAASVRVTRQTAGLRIRSRRASRSVTGEELEPSTDWKVRVFGSVEAWRQSRTRYRFVARCRPRKEVIHIRLLSNSCIRRGAAVADFGYRPRVVYQFNGVTRVAVGRRGEHVQSLAMEIALKYPGCELVIAPFDGPNLREVGEYVAGWRKSEHAAKSMGIRKSTFLSLAKDPTRVEYAVAMDDDFSRRLWAQEPEFLPDPQPARTAIWKTRRSGELTTRGKPKLEKIGEECWYGGTQLHRSPPVAGRIQRWQESDLIGLPVPGDWGTKPYVDD